MTMLVFTWIYFIPIATATAEQNATAHGRLFSLFSVVQFPNLLCTTTSGTFSNGYLVHISCLKDKYLKLILQPEPVSHLQNVPQGEEVLRDHALQELRSILIYFNLF